MSPAERNYANRKAAPKAVTRAKSLRRAATEAEVKLWSRLRRRQLDGNRFRRQVPIGPFIVDFACLAARVVVEVDGGQHLQRARYDVERDQWLSSRGYRVVRVWNNDVFDNLEGVLVVIGEALRADPPPHPSPSRGEGVQKRARHA